MFEGPCIVYLVHREKQGDELFDSLNQPAQSTSCSIERWSRGDLRLWELEM